MGIFKDDNDRISKGEYPRYVVWTERMGCPFVSAEIAIKWHNELLSQGVENRIIDLTEYDWEINPYGFKVSTLQEH